MRRTRGALLLGVVVLTGCASQASLTVLSQPEGAYMTEKGTGKVFGIAPTTIVYDAALLKNFKTSAGCFLVKGFEARWVSGATASLEQITLCGTSTGAYNITFSRPGNFPDLERDLQFALQVQNTRAQQQQARAAQEAALAAQQQQARAEQEAANAAMLRAFNQPRPKPINCTSTQVGNNVQTTCY